MTPQISLAHLARPSASRIIVPFFSATASRLEPPRPAAAAVRATRSTVRSSNRLDHGPPVRVEEAEERGKRAALQQLDRHRNGPHREIEPRRRMSS
jgi:hypothetical protein